MMQRLRVLVCIWAILVAGALPPMAQISREDHDLSAVEQAPWAAIGQITYGGPPGGAICTGALVATDLVLTAGHCVAVNDVAMRAADIQFAAGWRAGASVAIRHGKEIILAEPTAGQPKSLSQDVALIVLDAPIDADVIHPLPLSRQDLLSEIYTLIGYRRDAPDIMRRNEGCDLAATQPGVLQLGCPVVSGNSGAPVLAERKGIWQIAAVMAAAAGARSYAVIPGDDLRAAIAAH